MTWRAARAASVATLTEQALARPTSITGIGQVPLAAVVTLLITDHVAHTRPTRYAATAYQGGHRWQSYPLCMTGDRPDDQPPAGASPYATGGGGTVLEHRYGAVLLARLLVGDPVPPLGDDVTPVHITFQASAFSSVDDIVVTGSTADGEQRLVSIGVRRAPKLIASETSTVKLFGSYLRIVGDHWPDIEAGRWRLGLAVAGPNTAVRQAAHLAEIARSVPNEVMFREEVARPGRTTVDVRRRLTHLDEIVAQAAADIGADEAMLGVGEMTWRLLYGLWPVEIRLEGTDLVDRNDAVVRLRTVTPTGSVSAADALFSRLAELMGTYAPAAATVNTAMLGRDLAGLLVSRPPVPVEQTGPPSSLTTDSITLDVIMRGPLRALGFADEFDKFVEQEQSDPAAAACGFADIAHRLATEGFDGHADALRRRAAETYAVAGQPDDARRLYLQMASTAILNGQRTTAQLNLRALHSLADVDGDVGSGESVDPAPAGPDAPPQVTALSVADTLLDIALTMMNEPMLAVSKVAAFVEASGEHWESALKLIRQGTEHSLLLFVMAVNAVTVAEYAVTMEAYAALVAQTPVLDQVAEELRHASSDQMESLSVRVRLALAEAHDPLAAPVAAGRWARLRDEAGRWDLAPKDCALVCARYARARATYAAASDADSGWRRAVEFGGTARLFGDSAGWLLAQWRLRHRYGPLVPTELDQLTQMIALLDQQPGERLVPIAGLREDILADIERGGGHLRSAAVTAQHLLVLTVAAGLWEDEREVRHLLANIYSQSGELALACWHRIRAGDATGAAEIAQHATDSLIDVTADLTRSAPVERAAAYSILSAQADLIADDQVDVIARHASTDIAGLLAGHIYEPPMDHRLLPRAAEAAAAVAGRISSELATSLLAALDPCLNREHGSHSWTDEAHLALLVAVAAGDDDGNAATACERLARLLEIGSPALRHSGRVLGGLVARRPDDVRAILISLADSGRDLAAELLAGWSLTGPSGRTASRTPAEQEAWRAALPYAEAAATRMAEPPAGTPNAGGLYVHFPHDAALVTILDPTDIGQAVDGMLRVAADSLHLAGTRQQALVAASVLVAGERGDALGDAKRTEVFETACTYARGQHDGSAFDDMMGLSHPLAFFRVTGGDITLIADGLHLAARASRSDSQRRTVLDIAAAILRARPPDSVLHTIAQSLTAFPKIIDGAGPLSINALAASPSESLRAAAAVHWAAAQPGTETAGSDELGESFARDPAPSVRRSLAAQLQQAASKAELAPRGDAVLRLLLGDPLASVRSAARKALNIASNHTAAGRETSLNSAPSPVDPPIPSE
jgi:hypothetical protein